MPRPTSRQGLDLTPIEQESLASLFCSIKKKIQEVIQTTETHNLDLIPADTWLERVEVTGSLASDRYSHEKLQRILRPLGYDYILIDTPPSLCWLTESALIKLQITH